MALREIYKSGECKNREWNFTHGKPESYRVLQFATPIHLAMSIAQYSSRLRIKQYHKRKCYTATTANISEKQRLATDRKAPFQAQDRQKRTPENKV
jgi:hypothetical protein